MEQDNHVVIDLETLGTKVNAPIIAIGAVRLNPDAGAISSEFYCNIDWESALAVEGIEPDSKTVAWWKEQNPEAKALLKRDPIIYDDALALFNNWLNDDDIVWGNGATFDIAMLEYHYWGTQKWKYFNVRDLRTIEHIGRYMMNYTRKDMPFIGHKHFALDDARHEALYLATIWRTLRDSLNIDREAMQ